MKKHADQALSYLTPYVPTISVSQHVRDAKVQILNQDHTFSSIHYTYILDNNDHLVGVISVKEVLQTPEDTPLTNFILEKLVVARRHSSAEKVAQLAISHNIAAVPIIDMNKRFLGVVTADDIHDILSHEHSKDILQFAGVRSEHTPGAIIFDDRPYIHIRSRLPWLLLGLGGGLMAAIVVGSHEDALSSHIMLAAFIPAIVYIADSVGGQTQMIFIRALSLNQTLRLRPYIWRETIVNVLLALILGGSIALISSIWLKEFIIGIILGISVFLTVIVSVVIAIVLPYVSQLLHKDPAIASGPIATVCRDILSLIIYLAVANFFVVAL